MLQLRRESAMGSLLTRKGQSSKSYILNRVEHTFRTASKEKKAIC